MILFRSPSPRQLSIGLAALRLAIAAIFINHGRQKLFVYERDGMACRICKTDIKQFTQGQRSTYWCAVCQR